jgi:putative DNA methylase
LWKGKKVTYRKKLIEVALPLDAINAASAREKSIRHGHSSTLHLWWAHLQSHGRMGAGSG